MRRLSLRRRRDEKGAISVIVAILMVALIGFGAIVIDVGSLYAERRQLQNGADSAALAVAIDCAQGSCNGAATPMGTATTNANANANDNATTVTQVCGTATGLTACSPTAPIAGWDCPAVPASGPLSTAKYVMVRVQTLRSGSALMPPVLARAIVPGYTGTTVKACARASLGVPSSGGALAMTISLCELNGYTGGQTPSPGLLAAPPPYPPYPSPTLEHTLVLHDTTKANQGENTCPAGPSGSDLPGGFGWLDDPNGNCTTVISINNTYQDKTGVGTPSSCKTALTNARTNKTVVYIPIYKAETGTGNNGVYTLAGFSAFVVTGYALPGLNAASWLPGSTTSCKGSAKCIYGIFTTGLIPAGSIGSGGTSFGANVVQLSG
jgi:Flp pilus assembly protein TadG